MDEMWNQFFSLRHDKPRTLQLQIRQQLIDAITNGLIGSNEPLPSSRNLAKALKVARNTVIAAYKELEFDGYTVEKVVFQTIPGVMMTTNVLTVKAKPGWNTVKMNRSST